jgi:hypothetical protein
MVPGRANKERIRKPIEETTKEETQKGKEVKLEHF